MRAALQARLEAEGLRLLGVVTLDCEEDYQRFRAWLDESRHAGMSFMENHGDCRRDPARLLPGARAAVVVGLPYSLGDTADGEPRGPRVAQYARLRDYHRAYKRKVEKVFRELGEPDSFRVAVDTLPILERALAAKASEGFIGKNTCYIHPTYGSFLLLAEVLTTQALTVDERVPVDPAVKSRRGGCGACRRCQDLCPTGALDTDYRIDSNRCLAYWTIEHRGTIPEEFWPWLGRYYFGCDICQLVCPYNWKATGNTAPEELRLGALPDLYETATMDQAAYERYFGGTALTRAKRAGLKRNALIAMAVTKHPRLAEAMILARQDQESPLPETIAQIEKRCL